MRQLTRIVLKHLVAPPRALQCLLSTAVLHIRNALLGDTSSPERSSFSGVVLGPERKSVLDSCSEQICTDQLVSGDACRMSETRQADAVMAGFRDYSRIIRADGWQMSS
jgi:hypothetical protein